MHGDAAPPELDGPPRGSRPRVRAAAVGPLRLQRGNQRRERQPGIAQDRHVRSEAPHQLLGVDVDADQPAVEARAAADRDTSRSRRTRCRPRPPRPPARSASRIGAKAMFSPACSGWPGGSTPLAFTVLMNGASRRSTRRRPLAGIAAPPPSTTSGASRARSNSAARAIASGVGRRAAGQRPRLSDRSSAGAGDHVDRDLDVHRPRPRAGEQRERARQHLGQLLAPAAACG